jgi:hypothetical protein
MRAAHADRKADSAIVGAVIGGHVDNRRLPKSPARRLQDGASGRTNSDTIESTNEKAGADGKRGWRTAGFLKPVQRPSARPPPP